MQPLRGPDLPGARADSPYCAGKRDCALKAKLSSRETALTRDCGHARLCLHEAALTRELLSRETALSRGSVLTQHCASNERSGSFSGIGGNVKPVLAGLLALVLALGIAGLAVEARAQPVPASAVGYHPLPEATKKKKATPSATATPRPSAVTTTRRPVDIEGERWVQIAMLAGGGLLAAVLAFFTVGTVLRFSAKRRARR